MTRSAPAVPRWSNVRNGTNDGSDCLKAQCRRLGMSTACPSEETGNSSVAPCSRPMNSACARDSAGSLGERFGDQVVQMLGAAEHRSARIRGCASEERRPQQRRWAAWAPKIRRGALPGIAKSLGLHTQPEFFKSEVGVLQTCPWVEHLVEFSADPRHDIRALLQDRA